MRISPCVFALTLCASFVASATRAHALFHLWDIKEVFTNADGTVQFIEFFTTSSGETDLAFHTLTATSDGSPVTFTFDHDFTTSTASKHFLVATAGFAALSGGVTPDFLPLPANFFNPNATTVSLNFASGTDIVTLAGAAIPKNGVTSLSEAVPSSGTQNFVAGVNSPTNFAGAAGSVNLAPTPLAGDFDENGTVAAADLILWRGGFGMQGASVDHNDGDANADDDVDGSDFLAWQQQLGRSQASPAAATVPEPPTAPLLAACAALVVFVRRDRLASWPSSD